MKIRIDFRHHDDSSLDAELSRAMLHWKNTGKEKEYAEAILEEWKHRFYLKYRKSNNVLNEWWRPS